MKNSRLFRLLYVLMERGRTSAPELARQFEVSVRTIYRDIDSLSQAGIPVYTERGRAGGIRLLDGYVINRALMSAEEQNRLLMAVKSLDAATDGGDGGLLLSKLAALFRQERQDWLEVDFSRWGCGGARDGRFETLKTALLEKRIVCFRYAGAGGGDAPRRVKPARLAFKASAWYLQAYSLEKKAYRTFKLTRIHELTLTEERFSDVLVPPPIEPEDMTTGMRVVLKFSASLAYRVLDEFDGERVRALDDGVLLVDAFMPDGGWLIDNLLSFGGQAEVLEPESLRLGLARKAREVSAVYQKYLDQAPENMTQDVRYSGVSCPCSRNESMKSTQEVSKMEEKFCQSCGMPLGKDAGQYGTDKDGSVNEDYCRYCYENGRFTAECTMEEMIDFCVPHMTEAVPGMTPDKARDQMRRFFPTLKRWKQA